MAALSEPTRRQVLLGALAVVGGAALAGCMEQGHDPGGAKTQLAKPTNTVTSLLATAPFYVAHRGSGDNWTEHSMLAYSQSVAMGVPALEVSVQATSDGVFVCHHDSKLTRLTGDPRKISQLPYADVEKLSLDARPWLGPAAALQPIPTLQSVLDRFAASHVIFIEDKQGTNTDTLLDVMDSYPDSTSHFIWKQSSRGAHTADVQGRGYKVWGYFDADQADMFAQIAPTVDLVGLSVDADDEVFRRLVGYGKPVMAWEVHTRSQRDRLVALGVQGMMCSNIPYVCSEAALQTSDNYATGLRAAGDLPGILDEGWGVQPLIAASPATLSIKSPHVSAYLLGSLCPITATSYTLTADLRWPVWLPKPKQQASIAFGQATDQIYAVDGTFEGSGYHVTLQADGEIGLYGQLPGSSGGVLLESIQTEPLQEQQWVSLTIHVVPGTLRIVRDENPAWTLSAEDSRYRGGYISLWKNYSEALPVEFRGISVA